MPLAGLVGDHPERSVESVMMMQLIDRLAPDEVAEARAFLRQRFGGATARDAAKPHRPDRAARRREPPR